MPQFLAFTLAAPFASFGAVAVGERRPSWDRPSKSQILGLIAGALGIERREEARQAELARAYLFAVRVDDAGQVQSDYHTTQVPQQRRNRRFATRADELAVVESDLKTILSRREYRLASFYTVALTPSGAAVAAPTLPDVQAALRAPAFAPFAGRKANALMLPMTPELVDAADVETAFRLFDATESPARKAFRANHWLTPRRQTTSRIYADADLASLLQIDRHEQRRDMPLSRAKWRFGLRDEALLKPTGGRP